MLFCDAVQRGTSQASPQKHKKEFYTLNHTYHTQTWLYTADRISSKMNGHICTNWQMDLPLFFIHYISIRKPQSLLDFSIDLFFFLVHPSLSAANRSLTFFIFAIFLFLFSEGAMKEKMGLLEGLLCWGGLSSYILGMGRRLLDENRGPGSALRQP